MNDVLVQTIGSVICGFILTCPGIYMVVTGNPTLLHSYHYATTPAEELPALARESGVGLILAGLGCVFMGLNQLFSPVFLILGITCLIAGIAISLITIVRHNGSLISFASGARSTGSVSGFGHTQVLAVILGVVLGLVAIAPGAYMLSTGDVSMLHAYHYETIATADLPAFAFIEGISMIGLGVGNFICCVAGGGMTRHPAPTWSRVLMAIGAVVWFASIALMLLAIPYFGGSLA